jgi:hypothetical protein
MDWEFACVWIEWRAADGTSIDLFPSVTAAQAPFSALIQL